MLKWGGREGGYGVTGGEAGEALRLVGELIGHGAVRVVDGAGHFVFGAALNDGGGVSVTSDTRPTMGQFRGVSAEMLGRLDAPAGEFTVLGVFERWHRDGPKYDPAPGGDLSALSSLIGRRTEVPPVVSVPLKTAPKGAEPRPQREMPPDEQVLIDYNLGLESRIQTRVAGEFGMGEILGARARVLSPLDGKLVKDVLVGGEASDEQVLALASYGLTYLRRGEMMVGFPALSKAHVRHGRAVFLLAAAKALERGLDMSWLDPTGDALRMSFGDEAENFVGKGRLLPGYYRDAVLSAAALLKRRE